ncbi:MAG: branched-chain amino acid ABC transporter substrate-binding protein [Burkholderiales bacterium]
MKPRHVRSLLVLAGAGLFAAAALPAAADQTVKIAYIDPLSGAFANVGEQGLKQFQFVADDISKRGLAGPGVKLEVVPFDNKVSPQESLNQLKQVIDGGIRYITQGNGSGVAGVLIDAVNKQNERNPGQSILYLNYAAVDPDFTNSKCSFWHFRFDANSDMKMEALTDYLAKDKSIHAVYLINQNYSFGQAVARAAKEYLARKRPDIRIVGDDLHPLGQVKDFSPYVAKIKASGADTVITGNWGNDMSLLVKAARDANLNVNFYTYYAGGLGTPTALGEGAVGKVKQITEWHSNVTPDKVGKFAAAFKKKYGIDFYYLRVNTEMYMLAEAMRQAKSADPLAVARKLEGMKWMSDTGEVEMRATDHQLTNPLYISTLEKTAAKGGPKDVRNDVENTGLGFETVAVIPAYVAAQPTSCQMQRP